MKNLIGTTIKQYQILLKIRETGTRILYRAFDTKNQKHVGLEVVKPSISKPAELYKLLSEQSKKNARLEHPNIPAIIDSGINEGMIFFVVDFAPFNTLRRLFNLSFTWQQTCKELVTICQIVAYAHQQGTIHGFLHPASIVLDEENNHHVFDFGFEQIILQYRLGKNPGSWINVWGYAYCSPEQLANEDIDARSDVYSMGMILYEWMTGEIALLDETVLGTLFRRKGAANKDLHINNITPDEIQIIIQKSTAVQPQARYQTMQELAILLARGALGINITPKIAHEPVSALVNKPPGRLIHAFVILVFFIAVASLLLIFNTTNVFQQETQFEHEPVILTIPTKTQHFSSPTPTNKISTVTPTQEALSASTTLSEMAFPIYEGDKLVATNVITSENVERLITLSLWGSGEINRFTISPDGSVIATASSIGIFLYDVNTLELIQHIDTRSWVSVVEFSPDNKIIASGDRDGLIVLWDRISGQEIRNFSGHTTGILDLSFSPDGSHISSVSLDSQTIQWSIFSELQSPIQLVDSNQVRSITYSANGDFLITAGDDYKVNVWNAQNLDLETTFTLSGKPIRIKNLKSSNFIVAGGNDRKITLLNLKDQETAQSLSGIQYNLSDVAVSSNEEKIAGGDIHGSIIVWDINGNILWKFQANERLGQSTSLLSQNHTLMFHPDGSTIYSGLRNGIIRKFNAATGDLLEQYGPIINQTTLFEISPDGKLGVSQQVDGTIQVREMTTGIIKTQLPGEIKSGGAFSQNSQLFAIALKNSTVKIYDATNWREVHAFHGHQNIQTIKFVHNDMHIVIGNVNIIRLWSLSSGQELKVNKNFNAYGCTTLYDPSQKALLNITAYHYIVEQPKNNPTLCRITPASWMKSFQVNEKTQHISFGGNSKLEVLSFGSTDQQKLDMQGVNRVNITKTAINPFGTLLAAALDDHTIRIWSISTQQEIMRLYGHKNSINDLVFSPDGVLLLSSSLDGTIRLWGIP